MVGIPRRHSRRAALCITALAAAYCTVVLFSPSSRPAHAGSVAAPPAPAPPAAPAPAPAARNVRRRTFTAVRRAESSGADLKGFKAKEPQLIDARTFEGAAPQRLIFIGDIHGSSDEFNALLAKVQFKQGSDQIILVGDLVAKGPNSADVVRKARTVGAWAVRGNHDDRVIRWRQFLQGPAKGMSDSELESQSSDFPYDDFKLSSDHYKIAKTLGSCEAAYLASFPAIMTLPEPYSEWVVVHGGLVPTLALAEQKPEDVMTTRNIGPNGPSSEKDEGEAWFDVWAAAMAKLAPPGSSTAPQRRQQNSTTSDTAPAGSYDKVQFYKVIYGHDAGRSLQIHDITKGLDSRCVYGGNLTAFILPGEKLVSVPCKEYVSKDKDN
ncbi:hypothetical protein H4R18_000380 [Coemansia javaensis]|uniref:Calcineurin-like phosphoesterase domain-containing protein n=1 Tax=Coemansia javaensis TaxID=2761396 RepID=A0A9W8HMV1_9FUNG|nr:hypothetical protein H4R18_000380 [Coemansia javaensis]